MKVPPGPAGVGDTVPATPLSSSSRRAQCGRCGDHRRRGRGRRRHRGGRCRRRRRGCGGHGRGGRGSRGRRGRGRRRRRCGCRCRVVVVVGATVVVVVGADRRCGTRATVVVVVSTVVVVVAPGAVVVVVAPGAVVVVVPSGAVVDVVVAGAVVVVVAGAVVVVVVGGVDKAHTSPRVSPVGGEDDTRVPELVLGRRPALFPARDAHVVFTRAGATPSRRAVGRELVEVELEHGEVDDLPGLGVGVPGPVRASGRAHQAERERPCGFTGPLDVKVRSAGLLPTGVM